MNVKIPNTIIEAVCLLEYERQKQTENCYRWVASKLPKRLVYFATIDLWAKTTTGMYSRTVVCELTVDEGLRRYEKIIKYSYSPIQRFKKYVMHK